MKRKSKQASVRVKIDESERLKETLDVLSDPDLMRQIRSSERYLARGGKGRSFEEVFGVPLQPHKKRAR